MLKLTLYIVDDDPMSIMNLKMLLDSLELETEIVGNASNGVKAVKDILRLMPDFVFADIMMPVMDGLEMSKEVLKVNSNQIIFLLTAYQDFEYAKQGIKLGVKDYIVKNNLSKELLENVLRDNIPELKKQKIEQHSLMEKNIRNWLLSNNSFELNDSIYKDKPLQRYVMFYVAKRPVISIRHCEKEDSPYVNCLRLQETMNTAGIICHAFVENSRDEYIGICLIEENFRKVEENCCILAERILQVFNEQKEEYVCIVSKVTNYFVKLHDEYLSIKQCMNNPHILSNKTLFMHSEFIDKENYTTEAVIEEEIQNIKRGFYNNNRELAIKSVSIFLEEIQFEKSILKCLDDIQGVCQFIQTFRKEQKLDVEGFQLKDYYNNFYTLKEDLTTVVDECFSILARREQSRLSPKVILALEFISKNYKDNISVIDIAEAAGVSEGHLRRCFRKELNQNVVSYLMEYRLNCAKKLLRNAKFSVEDVCKQTGFSSSQYFCYAFKKNEGISPKEYANELNGIKSEL